VGVLPYAQTSVLIGLFFGRAGTAQGGPTTDIDDPTIIMKMI